MNSVKDTVFAFVIVFVASLASSLAAAAIYNIWFAGGDELQVTCVPKDQIVPKLNW